MRKITLLCPECNEEYEVVVTSTCSKRCAGIRRERVKKRKVIKNRNPNFSWRDG